MNPTPIPAWADSTATCPRTPAPGPTLVQLHSGACFDLAAPDFAELRLTDIATGLARLPRFLGATATERAYTVAQHSVLVMELVTEESDNLFLRRAALLHDAHEALMGDIPTPVKHLLGREAVAAQERRLAAALFARFGLRADLLDDPRLHAADRRMLNFERRNLLARPSRPWGEDLQPVPKRRVVQDLPTSDEIWPESMAYALFLAGANALGLR